MIQAISVILSGADIGCEAEESPSIILRTTKSLPLGTHKCVPV